MSIPLPAILVPPAPIVYEAKLDDIPLKRFVLCITRDLSVGDRELFRDYKLLEYDDRLHRNIPIGQLRFDFLVLDIREKGDRYAFLKEIQPHREQYNIIVYCHGFEIDDIEILHDNIISSFPEAQARREDFEMILLMERIKKPKWWLSLLGCIVRLYQRSR